MKINEVEQAVGITKKNIRFYEKEGLLHPARNTENGYRDYAKQDVEELKKIKLLRKLAIPLEEIRNLQSGRLMLEDGLRRHLVVLERDGGQMDTLDASAYLEEMEQMEQEGMRFMNVRQVDQKKKWQGSLLAGGAAMLFCVWLIAIMVWALVEEPIGIGPTILMLFLVVAPVGVAVSVIFALIQRKKEIQEGEEDAASKY